MLSTDGAGLDWRITTDFTKVTCSRCIGIIKAIFSEEVQRAADATVQEARAQAQFDAAQSRLQEASSARVIVMRRLVQIMGLP